MHQRTRNAALLAAGSVGAAIATRALLRRRRAYDLRDRVVLITGGSRGLGLVMAREFAREGALLAICARDPAELDRARDDLERRGAEVFAEPCDVTDRQQVQDLVRATRENNEA